MQTPWTLFVHSKRRERDICAFHPKLLRVIVHSGGGFHLSPWVPSDHLVICKKKRFHFRAWVSLGQLLFLMHAINSMQTQVKDVIWKWRGIPIFHPEFLRVNCSFKCHRQTSYIYSYHGHPKWEKNFLSPWVSEGQIIFQIPCKQHITVVVIKREREREITNLHPTILRVNCSYEWDWSLCSHALENTWKNWAMKNN